MTTTLLPNARARFFDYSTGAPLAAGKVYTYASGTTTPKSSYTDFGGLTPNANPVILDANGEANIWLDGSYKIVLKNSADVTQWTVDNVSNTAQVNNWSGTAGGTANALTITPPLSVSSYTAGLVYTFKASAVGNSGASTIAVGGLTPIAIQKQGVALAGSEIVANNFYRVVFDTATTCQLESISAQVTPFSDAVTLLVNAGDTTKRALFSLAALSTGVTRVYTLPDYGATLATVAGTELLSNKSFVDNSTRIKNNADNTKVAIFDSSAITTAITRTYTFPDKSGTLSMTSDLLFTVSYTSAQTVYSNGADHTFTHGLGAAPKIVIIQAICITAEGGYSINDIITLTSAQSELAGGAAGISMITTSTTIKIRVGVSGIAIANSTFNALVMTTANWKLIITAYA